MHADIRRFKTIAEKADEPRSRAEASGNKFKIQQIN